MTGGRSSILRRAGKVHLIGVGGVGTGGIAKILLERGLSVSGSDLVRNAITQQLGALGAEIFCGHRGSNLGDVDVVVISSAIPRDNPEIIVAERRGIPVIRRGEMLAELMRSGRGIAVIGAHGKTTTTSMLADIYVAAGLDPTFIAGGISDGGEIRARSGCGSHVIAEADESDASFLHLRPSVLILTGIGDEHVDTYGGLDPLRQAFVGFLNDLPPRGWAMVCADACPSSELRSQVRRRIISYGFGDEADLRVVDHRQWRTGSSFALCDRRGSRLEVELDIPGVHNALNAAAAIGMALEEGISRCDVLRGVRGFQKIRRRFECWGLYDLSWEATTRRRITVVDDYGHHPTEILSSVRTARSVWRDHRLTMVFQPHRYTRTRDLRGALTEVLSCVDALLVLKIYPAGEVPIEGVSADSLCAELERFGRIAPVLVSDLADLPACLIDTLRDDDLLLVQGAGDVGVLISDLVGRIPRGW